MSSRVRRSPRVYRNYFTPRKEKYQYTPFTVNFFLNNGSKGGYQVIVPASKVAGIRKVKNIGFDLTTNCDVPLIYSVFYLPEGSGEGSISSNINKVTAAADDTQDGGLNFVELYAANQWVIGCGSIIQGTIGRFRSRMARNLNNGDLVLVFVHSANNEPLQIGSDPTNSVYVSITGSYAIKYN